LTGVFATPLVTGGAKGALYGDWHQLGVQLIATAFAIVYSGVITFLLFKLIDKTMGIRVVPRVEEEGLDLYEHGENAYN
jgi:Amt family ammonium transporter